MDLITSSGESLDGERFHDLSVGLALTRNDQDRIGNPLAFAVVGWPHPEFHAGGFKCSVHGFDLGIIEKLPHPFPR